MEYHHWYTPRLNREMGVAVYGHWGPPLIAFPTSGGDEWEMQNQGMIAALGDFIEAGRIKIYTVASIAGDSFYNKGAHPFHRSYVQKQFDEYVPAQPARLYAADGRFIAEVGLERRSVVTLDQIPRHVTDAFVITEDKRFYGHRGVDYTRVIGSLIANIRAMGFAEGFSTITMQLARNVFPEQLPARSKAVSARRKCSSQSIFLALRSRYPFSVASASLG